jgi:phenylalanine-4-hydroxylase
VALSYEKALSDTDKKALPMNQEQVLASIPSYLRPFCVQQNYDEYTSQDQAVWRYIMHRNMHALRLYAHPAYVDGLEKTGINIDRIPDIDEMNECLGKIGWRAVVVDGFVPPAAFMEFQEHKILVISAEIRNINNVLYTPAPDIVHEAAGHAPIIAEPLYAEFLQRVGAYGAKAVFSKLDYELYEAIRYLSIIKEYPDATEEEILKAENAMHDAIARNTEPSEAALLSRFHWWTVEYGLMGTPEDFNIFGAGILSSVGESKACLDPKVKKIPLTVDCVLYNYDITEMQPQLFVAKDFDLLLDVLEDFASNMCFRKGGYESVLKLIASENVGTCTLDSGLQISGVFTEAQTDSNKNVCWIKTVGPSQLAWNDQELCCHGIQYHNLGYATILGNLKGSEKPLYTYDDADLAHAEILIGESVELTFESEYQVRGVLKNVTRRDGNLLLLALANADVIDHNGNSVETYSDGIFYLSIGSNIISAYSGSADRAKFNVYPEPSKSKTIKVIHTREQKILFSLYEQIAVMRTNGNASVSVLSSIHDRLEDYPNEWLIRLEMLELCMEHHYEPLALILKTELMNLCKVNAELDDLIKSGLEMMGNQKALVDA